MVEARVILVFELDELSFNCKGKSYFSI